jgi:hypothetical protein
MGVGGPFDFLAQDPLTVLLQSLLVPDAAPLKADITGS